jgi:membrane-associated phospholipid phosphatase
MSLPNTPTGSYTYDLRPTLRGTGVVWAGLILYSTLATKQHVATDIVAGAALGLVAAVWTWRQ